MRNRLLDTYFNFLSNVEKDQGIIYFFDKAALWSSSELVY